MSMPTNKEINVPYKTNTVEKYPYIVYAEIENKLKFLEGSIDELESSLPSTAFTDTNTVKKYIDDAITNVNTELAQRAICFDTVADMAAATDLATDMICHTNGFHTSGDGGAAWYEIKSTGTANAMDIIACQDSLLAHLIITEPFVTPEMFGAYGDGTHDDTSALQYVLKYCSDNKLQTFIANKYIITDSLNHINDTYTNLNLNIIGNRKKKPSNYSLTEGGIKLNSQGSVFMNANINGSIMSTAFLGERNDNYTLFYNVTFNGDIKNCYIANFGAIFLNCRLMNVSHIDSNFIVSAFYFMKCDKNISTTRKSTIVDTIVTNNYINGGAEPTDNAFIECDSMNGCIVANNFIDYYKVMYRFKKYDAGSFTWQGGISVGNQYQVFLYFYNKADGQSLNSVSFTSVSDCFNWTSETAATTKAKFDLWTRDKYTGRDNNLYDTPNYIFRPFVGQIVAQDAIIQNNVGNYIFMGVFDGLTAYEYCRFDVQFAGAVNLYSGSTKIAFAQGGSACYNNGANKQNRVHINIIEKVDSVPSASLGWTRRSLGMKILYNTVVYTLLPVYENGSWRVGWFDELGNEAS